MTTLSVGPMSGAAQPLPGEPLQVRPEIFQGPKGLETEARMREFCKDHCPGSNLSEVAARIIEGERLEALLADPAVTNEQLKKEAKPEAVVNLMWLLTAKAARNNDLYTNGAMRLDQGGKVEEFLYLCGKENVYPRISTHMKENLLKGKDQHGLDLRDLGLPANKQTLLFVLQPDGSLYLKMEENGCPPFWKKGFRTKENFMEFVRHSIDYVKTCVCPCLFKKSGETKIYRKEHVDSELKQLFGETMKTLYPPKENKWFGKLLTPKVSKTAKTLAKEGAKFGVSRMKEILDNAQATTPQQIKARANMEANLASFLNRAKARNYTGQVKCDEVVLAKLGV